MKKELEILKDKIKMKIKYYNDERVKIQKCNLGRLYKKEEKDLDNLKILNRIIALRDFEKEIDNLSGDLK